MKENILQTNEITENETKTESKPHADTIILSNTVRWSIFVLLVFVSIVSSFDGGVIPAATERMRKDLNLNDAKLGIFGSIDYVGRLFGSLAFIAIISKVNRKFLLIGTIVLKSVGLFLYYLTSEFWILLINRGVGGMCQVFYTIYLPVWCDQFGSHNARTMMITIVQVGNPIGVISGFAITILIKYNWILSFGIEGISMCFLALILCACPSQYFSSTLIHITNTDTVSSYSDVSQIPENNDDVFQDIKEKIIVSTQKKSSTLANLKQIICEMVILFSALSNSTVFLAMTAIQYWGPDYMQFALNVDSDYERLISFSIVSITGPTCGVILGGISGSLIGGYDTKHSILICIIFSFISCLFSTPLPFINEVLWFSILLWGFFFFSGSLIPLLSGIIISSVPLKLKGATFSFSNFFLNLLGNLPAPFIYGFINNIYKEYDKRMAMKVIMYYNISAFLFAVIASIFRYRKFGLEKTQPVESLCEEPVVSQRRRTSQLSGSIAQIFGSYGHPEEAIPPPIVVSEEKIAPVWGL